MSRETVLVIENTAASSESQHNSACIYCICNAMFLLISILCNTDIVHANYTMCLLDSFSYAVIMDLMARADFGSGWFQMSHLLFLILFPRESTF